MMLRRIDYKSGDIVRLDNSGYPGLYEVITTIDAAEHIEYFDYDYFITKDECETEMAVKHGDLILVCREKGRSDI